MPDVDLIPWELEMKLFRLDGNRIVRVVFPILTGLTVLLSVFLSVCPSVHLSLLTDRRSCYGMLDPERCIFVTYPSKCAHDRSFFDTLTLQTHQDTLSTESSQPRKQRKKTRTRAKHVGHFSEAILVCDRNTLANGHFFCDKNGQK